MANVGAATIPADDLVGLGDGSGAKERGEEEGAMGQRERGETDEGGEREKKIGRERGLGKIREGGREGRIGKTRMKKCQPGILKHGIFNSCF